MANGSNWSKDELLERIDELETETSDLQDQLDAIATRLPCDMRNQCFSWNAKINERVP